MKTDRKVKAEKPQTLRTFIIIGTGISLVSEDIAALRAQFPDATIIAISDSWHLAKDADYIYSCDLKWWRWHYDAIAQARERGDVSAELLTLDPEATRDYGIRLIPCVDRHEAQPGLCASRDALHHGFSSGYQAVHIARNFGAERIVLLGLDYGATGQGHWFGNHPDNSVSDFVVMVAAFDSLARALIDEGITVINCTRETALQCFPRMPASDALNSRRSAETPE